jgi:hypothetical protein
MPFYLLPLAAVAIAFLYSSAGFGGATGYLAAMVFLTCHLKSWPVPL